MDYYNLLSIIDSPVANNWVHYAKTYCDGMRFKKGGKYVWVTKGASNLDELRERTKAYVLRRMKTDILDLPEKIITPIYLRLRSKMYEEIMGEYYDWYDKNPEESKSLTVCKNKFAFCSVA